MPDLEKPQVITDLEPDLSGQVDITDEGNQNPEGSKPEDSVESVEDSKDGAEAPAVTPETVVEEITLEGLSDEVLKELAAAQEDRKEHEATRKELEELQAKHTALIKRVESIIFNRGAAANESKIQVNTSAEVITSAESYVKKKTAAELRGNLF